MAEQGHLAPGGYAPEPPDSAALIAWPDDFGQRFTVMVDTEEEFDWSRPFTRDGHTTDAVVALPDAHRRFAEWGARLTFMVDYPVASDPRAVAALAPLVADGQCAIGTQLHPWVNPPYDEELNTINSFAGNLAPALEAAKIAALTRLIAAQFGRAPLSYRSGRYGIGPATLATLATLGYRIDSSMRARYDYAAGGGPDFSRIGNAAFWSGPGGAMAEVPLTTVFIGAMRGWGGRLAPALRHRHGARALLARTGMLQSIALTPEDMPLSLTLEAVRRAVGDGERLLNFSFHSPSLVPGKTCYVRDAADLKRFHAWWEAVFALLARLGVRAADEAELIAALDGAR